jgi:replicative DNA helicase
MDVPHNIESEQAILGVILIDNANIDAITPIIQPVHFYEPLHGRIFEAALALQRRGLTANADTLRVFFEDDQALDQIGGPAYFARLVGAASAIVDPTPYAQQIYDLAIRRELMACAQRLHVLATQPVIGQTSAELLALAEADLISLQADARGTGDGLVHIASAADESLRQVTIAVQSPGYIPGQRTGLNDLDKATLGLQRRELALIGARPSMGKTSLGTSIAINVAEESLRENDGGAVGFYSIEMASSKIAARMISDLTLRMGAPVAYHDAMAGELTAKQLYTWDKASERLRNLPIYVDEGTGKTVVSMRAGIRGLLRRHPNIKLLVVDHLMLIKSSIREENRVKELGLITQELKAIAKDFDIPVLLLAQLSRATESREDKRPVLSDLRASGEIEENADLIAFLYREAYYAERALRGAKDRGEAEAADAYERLLKVKNNVEIILSKNRNGPVETVDAYCNIACSAFRDLARYGSEQEDIHGI